MLSLGIAHGIAVGYAGTIPANKATHEVITSHVDFRMQAIEFLAIGGTDQTAHIDRIRSDDYARRRRTGNGAAIDTHDSTNTIDV